MKKVTNVTLGGFVFAIEDGAYERLAAYLKNIETSMTASPDYAEIAADIERAIAEKFRGRKRNDRTAVTQSDVDAVIVEMGTPEEVVGEEFKSDAGAKTSETKEAYAESGPRKRLYRDKDNAILGGVSAGIAQFFDIDPVIVRLAFVLLLFFNGFGVILYAILWLIVPAAESATDKYAMRGERMTVADITQRVKQNISKFDTPDMSRAKGLWGQVREALAQVFVFLGRFIWLMLGVARYIAGIGFILIGALGIAGLISAYSVLLFSDKAMLPIEAQAFLNSTLSTTLGIVTLTATFIVVLVPLLVAVLLGSSLLAKQNQFTTSKSVTLAVVWICALTLAFTTALLQAEQIFIESESYNDPRPQFNASNFDRELFDAPSPESPVVDL